MCANPDDPIFQPLFEKTFNLDAGDRVHVHTKHGRVVTKVWFDYEATQPEQVRIRIDHRYDSPPA
jgi:hypothetical protein